MKKFLSFVALCVFLFTNSSWAHAEETETPNKLIPRYDNGLWFGKPGEPFSTRFRILMHPEYRLVVSDNALDTNSFGFRRGQLRIFGYLWHKNLTYKVQNFLTLRSNGNAWQLMDLWVNWKFHKNWQIRAGQQFVNFDFENMQPGWSLQLIDRSEINQTFGLFQEIGLELNGSLFNKHLEWRSFIYNGEGSNQANQNDKFLYGTRMTWHILGNHGYLMPDLQKSETPHLSLAGAYVFDSGNANIGNQKLHRANADLAFKYQGASFLAQVSGIWNIDTDRQNYAYLAQGGYFVLPAKVELVGRYMHIEYDNALGARTVDPSHMGGGINYYIKDQHIKVQAEYMHLRNNAQTQGRNDHQFLVQGQIFY